MRQPTQHPMVLHGSAQWGILVQGQVCSKPVVVLGIVAQRSAQMALVEDDYPCHSSNYLIQHHLIPPVESHMGVGATFLSG
jgi:hypothetical protein